MRGIAVILPVFTAATLFCCETIEIVELPKRDPKMVVDFVGESGAPWKGRVYSSNGILDEPMFTGIEASVRIFENNVFAEQLALQPRGTLHDLLNYSGTVNTPVPGNHYRIEVTAPGFGTATSSYVQPLSVPVDDLVLTQRPSTEYPGVNRVQFDITIADPPGDNYYEIFITFSDSTFSFGAFVIPEFVDPAYQDHKELNHSTIFTDALFDNQRVTLSLYGFLGTEWTPTKCVILLRNLSPEYYRYIKTIQLQQMASGDPFAQPVKVETNIENGLGIFGGYTQSMNTFDIDK